MGRTMQGRALVPTLCTCVCACFMAAVSVRADDGGGQFASSPKSFGSGSQAAVGTGEGGGTSNLVEQMLRQRNRAAGGAETVAGISQDTSASRGALHDTVQNSASVGDPMSVARGSEKLVMSSAEELGSSTDLKSRAGSVAPPAADDQAQKSLINLRLAAVGKLKEYNTTRTALAELEAKVAKLQSELNVSRQRYKNVFDRREMEAKLKVQAEERVRVLKLQIPELEEHGKKVLSEKQTVGHSVEEVSRTYQSLLQQYQYLVIKLREDSFFETWIERRFRNLSPVLRGSIRKAARAMAPVVEGLEAAAEFNDKMALELAESVDSVVPDASRSAFYRGLFFYFGMILPLVSSFSLFHYARQYMSTLQTNQAHIMLSGYLFAVFCLCFLLTAIKQQDVLDRMRVNQETLFLSLIITHGFAIFLDLVVAIHLAINPAAVQEKAESVFLFILLIHAYFHIWRRVVLDLAVTVGLLGYFFYAVIFGSMFLDRTVGAMRRASDFAGIDYNRVRHLVIDFLRAKLGLRIPPAGSKVV